MCLMGKDNHERSKAFHSNKHPAQKPQGTEPTAHPEALLVDPLSLYKVYID